MFPRSFLFLFYKSAMYDFIISWLLKVLSRPYNPTNPYIHLCSFTGWEPLGAVVSTAPYCPVQHHNRNVCRLGHLHCHSMCKLLLVYIRHVFNLPFVKVVSLILPSTRLCCLCLVQESRDPRKLHWLFEMLMESPVNGEGGSFVDAWWVERLLP